MSTSAVYIDTGTGTNANANAYVDVAFYYLPPKSLLFRSLGL